ncbi:MAG: MATE family efflux transporter [Hamadaea sp.]|uniref:MATE family efflux transporter n=1 Tax=Hamadaea sp. TaxID=2024425 RepID=UPI00180C589A|nr:MATE family efflux transporter [Hamadaea sp.]NUR69427.1 MATE family efflux transporter [Hamadaea sp.]NUT23842.1 MATE family efflux transporter [Hamadaea sp.]
MITHRRALLRLAGPNYAGLMSGVVTGIIDVAWVARLGAGAAAAVAVATNIENLLLGVILAVSGGLTVVVSGRIGAGDAVGARRAVRAGWLLFAVVAPVVAGAGFLLRTPIARLFLDDSGAIGLAQAYLAISLPAVIVFYGQWMLDGLFAGHGDTRTPMRLALLANGLVLAADPILIYGLAGFPKLGVAGAALATAGGRLVAFGVGLILARRLTRGPVDGSVRTDVRAILRVGGPISGDFLVRMAGALGLVAVVGRFGVVAVAGYGIGMKALYVATMAFYAIRNAATIHLPRSLSAISGDAGEKQVVEGDIRRVTLRVAFCVGVVAAVVFAAGSGWILRAFTSDPAVIAAGSSFLRCIGPYLVGLSGVVAMGGLLQGAGRGSLMFAVTVVGMTGQLGLAWLLSSAVGLTGVWVAMGVSALSQLAVLRYAARPKPRVRLRPATAAGAWR